MTVNVIIILHLASLLVSSLVSRSCLEGGYSSLLEHYEFETLRDSVLVV